MRDYDTMIVLVPELTKEDIQKVIDRVKDIISAGGEVTNVEEMGTKTLAYKINKKYTEGYYLLINFKADKTVLDNLEHFYRITDSVIRSIIVNVEK